MIPLIPAMLALSATAVPAGPARVERVTYHGWAGAYRLSNGTVEMVFVPQIGRIMRYGYVGGPNVLWENAALAGKTLDLRAPGTDWTNFGGDKLWPAPQDRWGWPPDPVMDAGPQHVRVLRDGTLETSGPLSPKHHIRFNRRIRMAPNGNVTITNIMVNEADAPQEWSVWEVAQVDDPDNVALGRASERLAPGGYKVLTEPATGSVVMDGAVPTPYFHRDRKQMGKIGSDSPNGLLMRKGHVSLSVLAEYPAGGTYPDGGCLQEVYSNPDPLKYMEMELLSPLHTLRPHERYSFVTRWTLQRLLLRRPLTVRLPGTGTARAAVLCDRRGRTDGSGQRCERGGGPAAGHRDRGGCPADHSGARGGAGSAGPARRGGAGGGSAPGSRSESGGGAAERE